jgi:hypothetical protein
MSLTRTEATVILGWFSLIIYIYIDSVNRLQIINNKNIQAYQNPIFQSRHKKANLQPPARAWRGGGGAINLCSLDHIYQFATVDEGVDFQ